MDGSVQTGTRGEGATASTEKRISAPRHYYCVTCTDFYPNIHRSVRPEDNEWSYSHLQILLESTLYPKLGTTCVRLPRHSCQRAVFPDPETGKKLSCLQDGMTIQHSSAIAADPHPVRPGRRDRFATAAVADFKHMYRCAAGAPDGVYGGEMRS